MGWDWKTEHWDKETFTTLAKLIGRLAMFAAVVLGGAGSYEQIQAGGLKVETQAAAPTASEVETYGAYDNYREYIEDVSAGYAKCDTALEGFARHRNNERDWKHVLEACHSEGAIE